MVFRVKGFTAWSEAASTWKTNGSGKKPLPLFVLILCVNVLLRRLKMKFVLMFGLLPVAQCWEIPLIAKANKCSFHVQWKWKHQKLHLWSACQFLVFFLFSCRLIRIRIIIWACLQRITMATVPKSDFTNLAPIRSNCSSPPPSLRVWISPFFFFDKKNCWKISACLQSSTQSCLITHTLTVTSPVTVHAGNNSKACLFHSHFSWTFNSLEIIENTVLLTVHLSRHLQSGTF